jgi:hypothetical protein
MEDQNNQQNNMTNNSNFIYNLTKIYESNGNDKKSWLDLLMSVNSSPPQSCIALINYLNQKIKNEPSNPLNLDIIDFLIDFGPIYLLREISNINFMNNFFNLLRKSSGSGPEVQKMGIYLTKKWKEKASEYPNENFEGFIHNFQELNKMGIVLPPSGFKLDTYEQFISQFDIMQSNFDSNPFVNQSINSDMNMSNNIYYDTNNNMNMNNNFTNNNTNMNTNNNFNNSHNNMNINNNFNNNNNNMMINNNNDDLGNPYDDNNIPPPNGGPNLDTFVNNAQSVPPNQNPNKNNDMQINNNENINNINNDNNIENGDNNNVSEKKENNDLNL